ncbi:MAG TPA: hypothetical protein DDX75_05815 [Phycisphaerales bacterium]|nr:hypothetical protein [Phycisphaerales bacterium]
MGNGFRWTILFLKTENVADSVKVLCAHSLINDRAYSVICPKFRLPQNDKVISYQIRLSPIIFFFINFFYMLILRPINI